MNQKSSLYLLLKIICILAFLPFILVWGIWKKTDWNKRNKWMATAGIAVVFLFMIIPTKKDVSVKNDGNNSITSNLQTQTTQEQENAELAEVSKIEVNPKEEETQKDADINGEKMKVVRVVDGDTVKLENGKVVRYIGIDTPETVDPRKPIQCFGKEVSSKNKELVEGKEVTLVKDVSETDKYGRLLRYVYIDNTFVNDYLVKNGYAHSSSYPPDIKYQEQFKKSEEEAKNNKLGLWADDACKTEAVPIPTNVTPAIPTKINSGGSYSCNCSKTCPQMSSCAEAQYQLNTCGCSRRDADHDGIACDADCQ